MSIFTNAITKISTEGGSFIQVSPFGFENLLGDSEENVTKDIAAEIGRVKSNIKIISDNFNGKGLLPPRKDPSTGRTLPGQVLIPHTLAIKLLHEAGYGKRIKNMKSSDWKKLFKDPKTRELIGYRIPNQGMNSNDTLEIVGVLPSAMGDSIIGYDGIPAKTGSDFDIDKMYIMAPNIMYNKKDNKFEVISEENKKFYKGSGRVDKLIAQNKLLNLYSDLLQSPLNYDTMMRTIDSTILKEDVNKLHPKPEYRNLDLFTPITQLVIKNDYMAGGTGIGLVANQLVDHMANQSISIGVTEDLGMGTYKKGITLMDEFNEDTGNGVANIISEFLNAYVDIAKDNYITRGNHNDITSNVTLMLLRAGGDIKRINRYIGQPILKDLVKLMKRSQSVTGKPLEVDGRIVGPYEYLRITRNLSDDTAQPLKDIRSVTTDQLEKNMKVGDEKIQRQRNGFFDIVCI